MDPSIKMLLDEIRVVQSTLASIDGKLTLRIDKVESSIAFRFDRLEGAVKVFDNWKPQFDASMDKLRADVGVLRTTNDSVVAIRTEMTTLRKSVGRVVLDAVPASSAGILPPPPAAATAATSGMPFTNPFGRRVESSHRGFEFQTQSPVKGTPNLPNPHPSLKLHRSHSGSDLLPGGSSQRAGGSGGGRYSMNHVRLGSLPMPIANYPS